MKKLTETEKQVLRDMGFPDKDFRQIEEAMNRTVYVFHCGNDKQRIPQAQAVSLLGERKYLAGISRSAFHQTARQNIGNGRAISFDSSKMFK